MIPKTLAVNAAKDATELVAKLRAYHHTAQTNADKKHLAHFGLDLIEGRVRNNVDAGVLEPALSKTKMIQVAVRSRCMQQQPDAGSDDTALHCRHSVLGTRYI